MLHKRKKIIKYTALFMGLLLWINPISALAAEEIILLEEEEGTPPYVSANPEDGIDTEAIYNSIDVEALRASIDTEELMALIDEEELLSQIDEEELKAELARREAEKENQRKDLEIETGTINLSPTEEKELPPDVTRIEFPVIENNNLFDFIMDPLGLVYLTNAAKYGGGNVKENSTLLFKNNKGEYLFSDTSDYLSFRNKGTVPVKVIIKATMSGLGNLEMTSDKSFTGIDDPAIYLALTDTEGNEVPLLAGEETVIETVLEVSTGDKTVYKWNSDNGSYEATENVSTKDPGAYFFALTGRCNPDADWHKVTSVPMVKVCWSAYSLTGEELQAAKEEEAAEKKHETETEVKETEETKDSENVEQSLEEPSEQEKDEASEEEFEEFLEEETEAVPEKRLTLEEAKLEELRMEKLEELKQQKLQELIEEKLQELIQAEFERLYQEALNKTAAGEESSETQEP